MIYVVVAAASFIASVTSILWVRRLARSRLLVDVPNERSSHARPVPRLGGVGIVTGVTVGLVVTLAAGVRLDGSFVTMVACAGAVAVLGGVDDLRPLRTGLRLSVHLAVATAYCLLAAPLERLAFSGFDAWPLGWTAIPFSVLWLVWMTNLYNFMDGIDGIAGVQAVVAGVFLGIAAIQGNDQPGLMAGIVIAAASLGFLLFNWHPATIFMGDVGSTFLGFLFGALAIRLANEPGSAFSFPAGVLVLSVFVFDTTFTLIRRILARERWYEAHRSHLYQRPQKWGMSHDKVTGMAGALMVLVGLAGLAYRGTKAGVVKLAILSVAFSILGAAAWFVLRWDRFHQGGTSNVRGSGDTNPL